MRASRGLLDWTTLCLEEIRQSGGLEEARTRLAAYEAAQALVRLKLTIRPWETPLLTVDLPVGMKSNLLNSPRTPFDGKVARDLKTFEGIIAARLRALGVVNSISTH
ncbi:hypothetical protein BDV19DRAFT_356784 [Aspergillus venezuelensis]